MAELPTGTVTFLLTDVEGSTELWERHPDAMRSALARHDELLEGIVAAHGGLVVRPRGEGDSRFAVFTGAEEAVRAVMEFQMALASEFTELPFSFLVRAGMNTGAADLRMGDYYGSSVNRCARIRGLGYGGQTLLSQVTAGLVRDSLPDGVDLIDLGSHHLKGLSRAELVYQLSIPGLPDEFPPLSSPDAVNNNLPVPPTTFIGREREVAEVVELLSREDVRLLTLTGPGGTGKTRLSLQASRQASGELLERFRDGVFFVDLAPIGDSALVATTIARALGIREGGGRPPLDNLKDYLSGRDMLLIFDNFEQVTGAATVVAELLAAAPKIKTLVTSRIPLQLRGEREFPVSPLGLPPDGSRPSVDRVVESESVRLFAQVAGSVRPGFEIDEGNVAAVVAICRRLDGLPLAIEIAAARVRMLPPESILKRLDQSLKLLVGGAADLPERHQTLRSAIDWSYHLLGPEEASLFARLSVFVGGFGLESAESVCSPDGALDVFSGVETLLNSSLLRRVESESGEPRFDMLGTIREYALEKLEERGEREEFRQAHAAHFSGKAGEMGIKIYGPDSVAWLARIDEEHDNFRAALSWGLEPGNDPSVSVQICSFLLWFWYRYGHFHEGRGWAERVVAGTESVPESPLHAMALGVAGMMAMWEGDISTADRRAEESIRILDRTGEEAIFSQARLGYGVILINQGRDLEAYTELTRAAELFDQLGDPWNKSTTLVHLANSALGLGEYAEARRYLDQAWPSVEATGDRWQIAFCLNNYGEVARAQGDYAAADGYYQRTEASFRDADALGDQARLIHTSGYLAKHRGELERARELFCESLERFRELGNRRGIAECLAGLAGVAAEEGRSGWAAPLLAAAEALLAGSGAGWWPADRVEVEQAREKLRSSLEAGVFEALCEKGRAMGMEAAIAYAIGSGSR